ncbi:MAG: M48 family metalloprotease [Phycisphaerae bacterium]|nr:M48 family metalloprotease [Phycisphaerae bacterium]
MYFVVIMAFALVLSDNLPPEQCNLLPGPSLTHGTPLIGTLAVLAAQLIIVATTAFVSNRLTLSRLDDTAEGYDRAANTLALCQRVLLGIIATALAMTMIFTPWAPLVREGWHLGTVPLVGDLLVLAPFFISLLTVWTIFYRVELRIKNEAHVPADEEAVHQPPPPANHATAALAAAKCARLTGDSSLGMYLFDKVRHQILIIAVPMMMIVLAKYFTDLFKGDLTRITALPWAADSLLGLASVVILGLAPWMLRYIWATEPLPSGPLRDRFTRTCQRIGLHYREILLWHTHGMAINAAVMGFIAPLRYIMVSDGLLENMNEEEIEAVFAHEAGHVQHWHLQFFVLFALISMYVAGGAMHVLWLCGIRDEEMMQLVALATLLAAWLLGFGWLSRRFERQADLYGVRCVTPDIKSCVEWCHVHGTGRGVGVCTSAVNLFGQTLVKIAHLNGIPKDAPGWRHPSIENRCHFIERFSSDAVAMRRFDRSIVWIKIGLVAASLVGTAVAAMIYGEQIVRAIKMWSNSPW